MLLDDTEQVIAKPREQVVSGKNRKAQIVCQPKSNSDQNRIQDDHGNTLEDAPLATMRAPLGDGLCNRACTSAWSCGSSYLPYLRKRENRPFIFGCLLNFAACQTCNPRTSN